MANGLIIGIDPGFTGAIAILKVIDGRADVKAVFDMPLREVNARPLVDAVKLTKILDVGARFVVIEQAQASPQMGVTSAFRYGEGYGTVCGVCAALGIRVIPAVPAVWKKHMQLDYHKDKSRAKAQKMFPHQSVLFIQKKDHGRAEASLLAAFGFKNFRNLLNLSVQDLT